jgi:hypothetical protein
MLDGGPMLIRDRPDTPALPSICHDGGGHLLSGRRKIPSGCNA